MENYKNYLNESRTSIIINNITYKLGDVIEGDKLDELSGGNIGDCLTCKFVLIKQPLNYFDDNVYNKKNLYATYSDEEDFTKLEKMKKDFVFLPPIPEKGDGLHRIVAAKELGYDTIFMWKEIK